MDLPNLNWGSVADWASAAGSVLASGVALYLAADANRLKASVDCSVKDMVDGTTVTRVVSIMVTNTGGRQFKVSGIWMRYGLPFKRNWGFIKMDRPTSFADRLFLPLNDGDQTHFGFPIEGEQNWVFTIREEMRNALDVATFRIAIRFTNGQSRVVKPDRSFRRMLKDSIKGRKAKAVGPAISEAK
ncbi:hypothetical protein EPZ47_03880 [Pseudomonas viciae]|uniref:Uncharacterized protein n=1 Tax=Pseudomonas viciae TaxID=2505979 RepID=A0A4P7PC25_9PSED|nr:hypothetical protein [Pseudomonas viciae]QBZ87875.1 hypothetical protein EPZ47_03880 [Pseudomonas viciae]